MSKKSNKKELDSVKNEPVPIEQVETFCDENWSCDIIFLVENDVPSNNFINIVQQLKTIQSSIKCLTKNEILKDVKKGAGKKGSSKSQKKGKDQTPVELTDEQKIMKAIKEESNLPAESLAKVIKKRLMIFKAEDIQERKKLYDEFLQSQKKKLKNQSKGSKKSGKEVEKPQSKGSKKTGSGKEDEKPHSKGSKKTGEEIEKPIEEAYTEKSALFIIISGFYEFDLPLELLKEDVPVRAVIKLNELPKTFIEDKSPKDLTNLESEKFYMAWFKFWFSFENLMSTPVNTQLGSDLALICRYIPDKINDPKVNAKEKKMIVQNELISIRDYIQMLLKRHKNYLQDTIVYDFSSHILSFQDSTLYDTLIQMVPSECTSVPFILSCIIEQVCFWNEENENVNDNGSQIEKTRSSLIRTCSPVIIMNNNKALLKTFHLLLPEINIVGVTKRLYKTSPLFEAFKGHLKLTQMENLYNNYHLQRLWKQIENKQVGINLFYIYLHWFILCKIKTFYLQAKNNNDNGSCESGHFGNSMINSFCGDLLDTWINEFIRLSAMKLVDEPDETTITDNKTDLDKTDAYLKVERGSKTNFKERGVKNKLPKKEYRNVKKIKMDRKENLKLLQNFLYCFEVSCLQENEGLPKIFDHFRNYFSYEYIEEMEANVMVQVLHESVLDYRKVENFFYPLTNKILLWFHNDKGSIMEESFSVKLNTLLGFRDYYSDLILPEEIEIMNETSQKNSLHSDQLDFSKENKKETITSENVTPGIEKSEEIHYTLGKTKIKFDGVKKTFVSEDGSTVTVETNCIYKTSNELSINITKIDTELKIYKNINENVNNNLIRPDEEFTAVLKLQNGSFMYIPVEEKNINLDRGSGAAPIREFFYKNFTITIPSGLIIELIKNKLNNETYVKQSYLTKGPVCNKIWDENCRCFLKNGTIIIFKNDSSIEIVYNNMVRCNITDIVEVSPKPPTESQVVVEPSNENQEKTIKKLSPKGKKNQKEEVHTEVIPEIKENITSTVIYEPTEHVINSWSGIHYKFIGGKCTEVTDGNVNLRTIFLPYKHLFVDRNDGMRSLLNDNGHMVSMFNDGTKVTTYFFEEEIGIEVSSDEIFDRHSYPRYESMFGLLPGFPGLDMNEDTEEDTGENLHMPEYNRNGINIHEPNGNFREIGVDLGSSSFVSVKLGCIMEHPNYATVEFFPDKNSIELTLPGNLSVIINETNDKESYNIKVTDKQKIKVLFSNESIEFSSNIIKTQKKQNVSTIRPYFEINESGQCPYFCTTFDSFNNIFHIDNDGDTKFIKSKIEMEDYKMYNLQKSSSCNSDMNNAYFDCYVPERMFNRFFVINDDCSGYEVIDKNDLAFYNLCDNDKYSNVSVIKNPTNGRIDSEMIQYLVYKTHSENYLVPYKSGDLFTMPDRIQRFDLGPTWNPSKSPWLFVRPEGLIKYFKRFSFCEIARHDDKKIIAVVVKTVQKVINEEFNAISIILSSLEKYNNENEEIIKKYTNQSFNDFEIDSRLKETHELIGKIKNEYSNLNINQKVCDFCKQSFGQINFNNYKSENEILCHDSSEQVVRHLKY